MPERTRDDGGIAHASEPWVSSPFTAPHRLAKPAGLLGGSHLINGLNRHASAAIELQFTGRNVVLRGPGGYAKHLRDLSLSDMRRPGVHFHIEFDRPGGGTLGNLRAKRPCLLRPERPGWPVDPQMPVSAALASVALVTHVLWVPLAGLPSWARCCRVALPNVRRVYSAGDVAGRERQRPFGRQGTAQDDGRCDLDDRARAREAEAAPLLSGRFC